MKCRDFEANVLELVNGQLEDSQCREALAHASVCGKCGALLEADQLLSADLRALAAEQSAEEAPPEIEGRLLASFRDRSAGRATTGVATGATSRPAACRILRQFRQGRPQSVNWRLWGTVAAGLALGTLALPGLLRRPDVVPSNSPPLKSLAPPGSTGVVLKPEAPPVSAVQARSAATLRALSRTPRARPPSARVSDRHHAIEAEVATDFYAMPYVEPAFPGETMRIVRTRVPRTSFAAFGFPVNGERMFDTVQADVLVGDDNVARAIRFVRQLQLPPTAPGPARGAPVNVK